MMRKKHCWLCCGYSVAQNEYFYPLNWTEIIFDFAYSLIFIFDRNTKKIGLIILFVSIYDLRNARGKISNYFECMFLYIYMYVYKM